MGYFSPTAIQTTKSPTPAIDDTARGAFFLCTRKPNTTDNGIKSIEAVATEPFAELYTLVPSAATVYPWNVEATISENAATTKRSTSHEKIVKSILHLYPIFLQ